MLFAMDKKILTYMQHGGNRRLREFLKKYNVNLDNENKIEKYKTRACRFYRDIGRDVL